MTTPAPIPVPTERTLRILAGLADGERLKDIAKRDGVTADALYRRLERDCRKTGARTKLALLALAVDWGWIARSFEGWIVPDPAAPRRGGESR